jgi:predicted AlkP superfamily pyrophosphatase or phosphodiesterase
VKTLLLSIILTLLTLAPVTLRAQNVFIVVIDGLRYSEAYPEEDRNLPFIWNELRPKGTIFTNFRNDGRTVTCPGHAAFLTGVAEKLKNDGSQRPENPTLFEIYRSQTHDSASSCYVVSGKRKLAMLTYSLDPEYGESYGGKHVVLDDRSDTETWEVLSRVMDTEHPRLVIVNFPSVDYAGHDADWTGYLGAIRTADSLVHLLWTRISSDEFYRGKTTLFVSSDHGRHDIENGGFRNHGCYCEGCRHIIGLGIGPGFEAGAVVSDTLRQTDVQSAVAELMSISVPRKGARQLLSTPR